MSKTVVDKLREETKMLLLRSTETSSRFALQSALDRVIKVPGASVSPREILFTGQGVDPLAEQFLEEYLLDELWDETFQLVEQWQGRAAPHWWARKQHFALAEEPFSPWEYVHDENGQRRNPRRLVHLYNLVQMYRRARHERAASA